MNYNDLQQLAEQHPIYIPISKVADFLHLKPEALRASIGPFGFSWSLGERNGYKIPTIAFVAWLTKGTMPMPGKRLRNTRQNMSWNSSAAAHRFTPELYSQRGRSKHWNSTSVPS